MAKEKTFEHPPRGHVAMLYYDVANDRFQVVQGDDVDTAIPANAKALLASILAHTYDGAAWHKQAPIWGYSDRYLVEQQNVSDVAATFVVNLPGPLPGEVWRVTGVSVYRTTNVNQFARVQVAVGVTGTTIEDIDIATLGRAIPNAAQFVLKAGDNIRVQYTGATVGETVITSAWGYKMSIDM